MDFGVSHMPKTGSFTVETATDASRGTMRWLAPELLVTPGPETEENEIISPDPENETHTMASDIWALGMVYLVCNAFTDSY